MVTHLVLIVVSLGTLLGDGQGDDQASYEGHSVMTALPKTGHGQTFLDQEIQRNEDECNVWKRPQKYALNIEKALTQISEQWSC